MLKQQAQKLEFTPLEFETECLKSDMEQRYILEFTPLEFETILTNKAFMHLAN